MSYLFQRYAKVYDKFMNRFSLDDDTAILTLIKGHQQRIADVGGGTGVTADKLAKLGHLVTIIDPCLQMTQLAKKRNNAIRVVNQSMPYEVGEQFNIVLIRDCLHHVKGQREMIDCCLHMLAEGGTIIVTDFSPWCWKTKLIFLFERCCFESIKPISDLKLSGYLESAGLQTERISLNDRDYLVWGRKA
jgi:2-polyprenyl-3-methyl-5-hydroxy-6-metoxy-1,4-benzoquinol methylase